MKPFNIPKAVSVERYGFIDSAPIWKKRGTVRIALTYEQQRAIYDAVPRDHKWQLEAKHGVAGVAVHAFCGYSDSPPSWQGLGVNAQTNVYPAQALYDHLLGLDLVYPFD